MRVLLALCLLAILSALAGCNGCHEEPTIVIRFEPSDADVKLQVLRPTPSPSPTPTPSPSPGATASKPGKKECKVAADCAVMPEDCCDCANGGRQHAIAKVKVAAAKASREAHCKHAMCTMMISTDPTCGMRADCVAGQCTMVKKK
jgi:hypothetical protein